MSESNIGGLGVSKDFNPTYSGEAKGVVKTEGISNEATFQFGVDTVVGDVLEIPMATKSVFVETIAFADTSSTIAGGALTFDLIWYNIVTGATLSSADAIAILTTAQVALVNNLTSGQYARFTVTYLNSIATYV